jgi:flagellar hook-length control protein FliK
MPAAPALAVPGSAIATTPRFAGLLQLRGRIASPSTPLAGELAVVKTTWPSANGGSPSAQTEHAAPAPDDQPVAILDGQPVATLEQALAAVLPNLPSNAPACGPTAALASSPLQLPLPGSLASPRSTAATRPASLHAPTAAADTTPVAAGGIAPVPALVPDLLAPQCTTMPAPQMPADSVEEFSGLKAAAAKLEPAALDLHGNGSAARSIAAASAAPAPAVPAIPAWPPAPDSAAATEAIGTSIQSALAATQPAQIAGPAPIAERAAVAPAAQPDAPAVAPAQQVSAALVSLASTPGGGQRMTLRLDPPELGQVHIRIDRPQDAPAQVEITVQRPETLTLLLRDQQQLQRALDQAGVPADGRALIMHVAPPDAPPPSGTSHSLAAASADPGQGGGHGAGTRSGGQGRPGNAADPDRDDTSIPLPRWLRAGLDITA